MNRLASLCLVTVFLLPTGRITSAAAAQAPAANASPILPADQLTTLLPAAVYFQGRTAALQLRNAAAASFPQHKIVWAALVDTSGYSTGIQEKYQFYLVTETPLQLPGGILPAGAYGGGFVGGNFLLMDLGGRTVAQGPVQTDAAFRRPRPLQFVPESPTAVKLYLGRRWITLQSVPNQDSH